MILIIDNYDSFTYNLFQQLQRLSSHEVRVVRNDQITLAEIEALTPKALVISPGPGGPQDSGISKVCVAALSGRLPILGVCLGHQAIASIFGMRVIQSHAPRHGKTSRVSHNGAGIFAGLPNPFTAMRYHSLVVEKPSFAEAPLKIDAHSEEGEIMALSHLRHPTFGVQFHPESFLTEQGDILIENFLGLAA